MAEGQASVIDDITTEEQAAVTDDITIEKQAAGTDDITIEEQAAGTDDITIEEQAAGTDDITIEKQAAGTDDITIEEQAAGTDDITIEEQAAGTDDITIEKQAAGTDDITIEEQAAGTDGITIEEQAAGTDDITIEEQAAGTDDITIEEQAAGTDDITIEKQAAGTDDITIEEQAAGTDGITIEEQAAGTDDITIEEQAAGTDDITLEEQAAGTDDITLEEQAAGTDDITIEEQAAGTDDISVDQIHLSLRYVRSEAAEKLSRNGKLSELRSQLWQKNMLCDDEFVSLGETMEKEGSSGMANKLLDCVLKKKDKHHKFLQEIEALDPEVHDLITDNLNVSQKISDHIRTTYKERKCHLVQVLPGEKLQLDLHRAEYVMPLVISAERLVRQERHEHWLPQGEVRHHYEHVDYENVEQIVHTMLNTSESVGLCTGIAGVGKTICTKKIVTGWVDGMELLQGYNIVLAIPVRDVNVNGSIIDMIGGEHNSLGLVTNKMKEILDYYLSEEIFASKVLVIVDGVDECDITAGSELYQFITGQIYARVKKLKTARPEATLVSELKSFYPDYKVIVQGTSKRGVYMYLKEIMTDGNRKPIKADIDKLISECEQAMVEFDLLLIPLYLTLVGFLFNAHWAQYCTFTNLCIPNTTTKLFSSFINILVRIWLNKIGRNKEAKNIHFVINPIGPKSNIPTDIKLKLIFAFGKISYDFIRQQKYTMSQADLDRYLIEIEDIKQSGMFCLGQQQGQMLCFFRHKTLQEFMASLYLAHVGLTEQTFTADIDSAVQSQENKTLLQVFPKLSIVLRFLFGLNTELCCKIIEKLSGHICVCSNGLDIELDYEASLLREVEGDVLSSTFVELLANTKTRQAKPYILDISTNVVKLCQSFSPQQRLSVLENWFNLHVYKQGHGWLISHGGEQTLSCQEPTDELCIDYFSQLLCMFLQSYEFNHIQSLTLKTSATSHIGFLQSIFPKVQAIKLNGLRNTVKSENELLISCTPEIQHSIAALVSSGSTNTNLHSVLINTRGYILPMSSVESLTQQAGLQSLTLSRLEETPPLWDVASRGLVSWINLSVLEISVFILEQENEFLEFLQKYTPKLTALTIGIINNILRPPFSALIKQALCFPPLSQLTTLRLFDVLDSEGVLALCGSLPPGLHTLGVGWEEVTEVTGHFMDTLCKQCPEVKHLHIGYEILILNDNRSAAVSVCRDLISHRTSHHVDSHIQVGAYDFIALEYEPENTLFPTSLVNTDD